MFYAKALCHAVNPAQFGVDDASYTSDFGASHHAKKHKAGKHHANKARAKKKPKVKKWKAAPAEHWKRNQMYQPGSPHDPAQASSPDDNEDTSEDSGGDESGDDSGGDESVDAGFGDDYDYDDSSIQTFENRGITSLPTSSSFGGITDLFYQSPNSIQVQGVAPWYNKPVIGPVKPLGLGLIAGIGMLAVKAFK